MGTPIGSNGKGRLLARFAACLNRRPSAGAQTEKAVCLNSRFRRPLRASVKQIQTKHIKTMRNKYNRYRFQL